MLERVHPEGNGAAAGIPEALIRYSVGIEDAKT